MNATAQTTALQKRIFIIGIVASGKTTLARQLSEAQGLPHVELDNVVHEKIGLERKRRTPEQIQEVISSMDAAGGWIMEGVYRPSYHCILDLADQVIFLDPPLLTRYIRILGRYVRQKLGKETCEYRSDFYMLRMMFKWTSNFERNRPEFERILSAYMPKLLRFSDNRKALSALQVQ